MGNPRMCFPFPICFIICCICWKPFSNRLTAAMSVPAPLAIRRRRLPSIDSGLSRSAGVIDRMIASISFN